MNDLNTIRETSVDYANKNLARATEKIYKLSDTIRKSAFETAAIIATVDANEWYLDDGFSNVHEWTESAFGFKKSNSYAMLKIGKEWTKTVLDEKGKVIGYRSLLTPEDAPIDYTTAQVGILLPLGIDEAKEYENSGEIAPSMTCSELRKAVKALQKGEDESEEAEAAGETESEAAEAEETLITVTDESGRKYAVPREILLSYAI